MSLSTPGAEQQFATLVEDLIKDFATTHTEDEVRAVVQRWRQDIEPSAKITDFIPVLVRRFSREELIASTKPAGVAV